MKTIEKIKVAEQAERFPVYLTAEEVSHIALALDYVDMDKYVDSVIPQQVNARLATWLASYYLERGL